MRSILAGLASRGAADYWPETVTPALVVAIAAGLVMAVGFALTIRALYGREKGGVE